jgi:hypothetical protein
VEKQEALYICVLGVGVWVWVYGRGIYLRAHALLQHATRRHIVICGLSGSTILFRHYLINGTIFGKNVIEHKMCVLIFFTTFIRNISSF